MRDSSLVANLLLEDGILIRSNGSEQVQSPLVHRSETVCDQRDRNPLPRRSAFFRLSPPEFGSVVDSSESNGLSCEARGDVHFGIADIPDIEHKSVQSPGVQDLVLVV